jgi:desulfoferrodoxin (superoxide reductase-like protein)
MRLKLLLVFILLIFSSQYVFSHSPVGIDIDVDFEHNRLSVVVNHPVGSPRSHYIKTIEIIADEQKPIVKTFHFQKANHQRTTVDIPGLDSVEKIVIKAYCNKGGFLSREFVIEKAETQGQGVK